MPSHIINNNKPTATSDEIVSRWKWLSVALEVKAKTRELRMLLVCRHILEKLKPQKIYKQQTIDYRPIRIQNCKLSSESQEYRDNRLRGVAWMWCRCSVTAHRLSWSPPSCLGSCSMIMQMFNVYCPCQKTIWGKYITNIAKSTMDPRHCVLWLVQQLYYHRQVI